jgi:hypothetical protein
VTILGLLLRAAIIYLIVRLIWRAFAGPRPAPRRPPPQEPDTTIGNDIVDAEWVDLDDE